MYRKAFLYLPLMVVHFDWYGGGYLCKHNMTNIHDTMVDT